MAFAALGMECVAYRNSGSFASPVWLEIEDIRDLTLSMEKGEADVTTRGNNGWEAIRGTLKKASIETQAVWDPTDPDFEVFLLGFLTNTPIDMAILDGSIAVNGSQGLRATFDVVKCSRMEPLTEAVKADLTLKPTYNSLSPPLWVMANNGTLVPI